MSLFDPTPAFTWSANDSGLVVRFSSPKSFSKAKEGRGDEAGQLGLIRMRMLVESGQAESREEECGIFLATEDAVRLDHDAREGFLLPPPWPGGMRLQTESVPQLANFTARLGLVGSGMGVVWDWRLRGPVLEAAGERYLPSAAQFAALSAWRKWSAASPRDEVANLGLLAELREAFDAGCHIDLDAYKTTLIATADELSVDVRPDPEAGGFLLRPVVSGNFPPLSADEIEKRFGQITGGAERVVLRVGKTIILLDPLQTRQARAVVERGRVPREAAMVFQKNPQAWMAEHVFPDIETEFSPRVTGVGYWKNLYAGALSGEVEDWFGKKPQPEKRPYEEREEVVDRSEEDDGRRKTTEDGDTVDDGEVEGGPVVPLIVANDEVLGFGDCGFKMENGEVEVDFSRYARKPLPHQEEAVLWMIRHARRAFRRKKSREKDGAYGAGALLADDMGLGKTFSTLIFLREWLDLWRAETGGEPPAVLIVAPLSLLENWKEEIVKSYGKEGEVFSRVLMAHPDAELDQVRRHPGSRDRAEPGEVKEYGLGFGDGTERSVDFPGSCVLTTYQTLRDYRFSFAKAEWSAVVFDEAQNLKNPNALQTIAAKSLKAHFRLTLTGTPVENHLGDFWCIIDTSEPGPLGSFAEFRRNWIIPMTRERERMGEIGQRLRDHVGELMLRRMKEEHVSGLPEKRGHREKIPVAMTAEQAAVYDSIIASVEDGEEPEEETERAKRQNRRLAALWHLRQVCLHPDLLGGGAIGTAKNATESRKILERSGKLAWLLRQLDDIKSRGEKALIFCVQKKLQEALARHLKNIYNVEVPVINGDTKAAARRESQETRLGLIARFSRLAGFGVCILSPIAAGAGLNITAANHVIHLERHWNPAKEDQATDRAYRIGQKRPVSVYLPAVRHPNGELKSFDEILHRLIEKKRGLQGALRLAPPQSVTDSELIHEVFTARSVPVDATPLDVKAAVRLPWRLFEALVAVLYEREAERVILTSGTGDRGCDVVVLNRRGAQSENLLIQCKTTSRDELDSELAVREVEGARPFYENALGVKFQRRCLHTNAKKVSKRTLKAAELCGVTVECRAWLETRMKASPVFISDLLARDARRERV